ncbi:MAG: DedA family protein [Cellulosilyticum sp.]|nr:DedA family protein [Cellulosilyticum sp.]MEE1072905.1 DedA family protein [Cellulosilyticum sp.]
MPSLSHFLVFMMSLIGQLGYTGVFLVIGLEYACFPIPSEIVLPFVGMSIPQTALEFLPAFLVSIVAGLTGSLVCYLIGLYGGTPLLRKLSERSSQLEKALTIFNHWFEKYGRWAVLFSRIIPLTRTYISLFAGVNKMPLSAFFLYSSTGIAIWNLVLMSLGFYLGHNWQLIEGILNTYSHIVLILIALVLVGYLAFKWHKSHSKA